MYLRKSLAILAVTLPVFSTVNAKSLDRPNVYDDMYFIGTYSDGVNERVYEEADDTELSNLNNFEVKYQISLSVPLVRLGSNSAFVAAYTQKSLWQAGNNETSAPFRETNYQPQLFIAHENRYPIFNHFELGYKHQSNGKSAELSRGWDRIYLSLENLNGKMEFGVEGAYVAAYEKNNSDIKDYIAPYSGWFKLYVPTGELKLNVNHNFESNRSGIQLGYSHYLNDYLSAYFQIWNGYGETLIDYNYSQTRVGVGFSLIPW